MARRVGAAVVLGMLAATILAASARSEGINRIFTIAGNGGSSLSGEIRAPDGAYATDVELSLAEDVGVAADGAVLFGFDDGVNPKIRRLGRDGRLSTLWRGGGTSLAVLPDGQLLVSDDETQKGPRARVTRGHSTVRPDGRVS